MHVFGKFAVSNVCNAFDATGVGSKVTDTVAFFDALTKRVNGDNKQFIVMPEALAFVESGDAALSECTEFVARMWRGRPQPFGARASCLYRAPRFLAVVVYTATEYMKDPDVVREGTVLPSTVTHVVVAVIASRAPGGALGSYALVHNIGGGNSSFLLTGDDAADAAKAREWVNLAKAAEAHEKEWIVLAD